MKNTKLYRNIIYGLFGFAIFATLFLLISSLSHIAKAFQAYEVAGYHHVAWFIAIGIEVFMLLSAFARLISNRKDQERFFDLALYYYTGIILLANIHYTFAGKVGKDRIELSDISNWDGWKSYVNIDPVSIFFMLVFSPTLPISAIIGTKIIQTFGENIGRLNRKLGKKESKPESENETLIGGNK